MRNKTNTTKNSTSRIIPTMPWRVATVRPLSDYRLEVVFLDGTNGEVDVSKLVTTETAGVFAALRNKELFNQVYNENGVVTWPGEIDLAPDAMYQAIEQNGKWVVEP